MSTYHYIHSQGGMLGNDADTQASDIDTLVAHFAAQGNGKMVIHFHGGLVNKASGLAIAERLNHVYAPHAFPVFYVWESGVWETIRNNLTELANEPVFKQLVRKLLEYSLKRLTGMDGGRSVLSGSVDSQEVRQCIETFWDNPSQNTIPYFEFQPTENQGGSRSVVTVINEAEIQADLEGDAEIRRALGTLPDLDPGSRSAMGARAAQEHRSAFSEALADQLGEEPGTRGIVTWYKVAKLVVRIIKQVLKRYRAGRDHGLYATVVEEIVRGVKLGGGGLNEWGQALSWNRMKQDVQDAFGADADRYPGTALLTRLNRLITDGAAIKRITLIGHSTGAIYIAEWLKAANAILAPQVKFDIVFLAPAITYERFARCLDESGQRIRSFRSFAMRDELERRDQVWGNDTTLGDQADLRRYIYPSSLLYLVSGILESKLDENGEYKDTPDMPLLGMERFFANPLVYNDQDFPEVKRVREWLAEEDGRVVWSMAQGLAPGLNCASIDHGAFDDDPVTLDSIRAILGDG